MIISKSFLRIAGIALVLFLLMAFLPAYDKIIILNETVNSIDSIQPSLSSKKELSNSVINNFSTKQQQQKTPRPTATPLIIPPPTNMKTSKLLIFFGAVAILVVITGVYLNKNKYRK